jgi:hypothetical protein
VPGGFEFSRLPTVRGCPRTGDAEFLSAVAQGAAAGQGPAAFPFAGWLGASSYPWSEVSPCRWRGLPLAGWLRVPPGQGPEVSRCRWLRISPCQRLGDPRCRGGSGVPRARGSELPVAGVAPDLSVPEARRSPLPGGPGFPPCRVAESFLFAGGSGFPSCLRPEVSPLPGGSGCPLAVTRGRPLPDGSRVSPFAGGSGFPLRRLPFPVVRKFLRLSREPHKRFPPTISRFFGRPQAVHS